MKYVLGLILSLVLLLLTGCESYYYTSITGDHILIGLTDNLKLQALSSLDGQIIKIKDKADIEYEYSSCSSNSYFNLIYTKIRQMSKIKINEK